MYKSQQEHVAQVPLTCDTELVGTDSDDCPLVVKSRLKLGDPVHGKTWTITFKTEEEAKQCALAVALVKYDGLRESQTRVLRRRTSEDAEAGMPSKGPGFMPVCTTFVTVDLVVGSGLPLLPGDKVTKVDHDSFMKLI